MFVLLTDGLLLVCTDKIHKYECLRSASFKDGRGTLISENWLHFCRIWSIWNLKKKKKKSFPQRPAAVKRNSLGQTRWSVVLREFRPMWIFLLPLSAWEKKIKTHRLAFSPKTPLKQPRNPGVLVIIAAGSEPLLLKNLERLREANVPRVGPEEGRVCGSVTHCAADKEPGCVTVSSGSE